MSAGAEGFEFRCGPRRWTIHEIQHCQPEPVAGISIYIVDVSTRGKVDEEWLHGRNARLCRGRVVLADNLVVAVNPLRCKPSGSAFRIRMEAIERIRAPGEIGSCRAAQLEELGDGRSDWIDLSATHPVAAACPGEPVRARRPRAALDRDPTPPPLLLRDGVVHCNRIEESAVRELAFDEQTTARLQGLALALRSKSATGAPNPRTGDTVRIDHAAYARAFGAGACTSISDNTQILSRDELEGVLAAAPLLRAHAELPLDAASVTRTQVMIRVRR